MVNLPANVTLDFSKIPVVDQGELGSATACVAAAMMEYMQPSLKLLYYEESPLTLSEY